MSKGIFIAAYILDLIFGDPQWRWHPVRLIGRFAEMLESKLNPGWKVGATGRSPLLGGVVLVVLVVGATCLPVGMACGRPFVGDGHARPLLAVLLIYFSLSIKALAVEAGKVYKDLKSGDIQKARDDLSMIVGRDTEGLSETEIIRASVETVAESTMDGIVAPMFYASLGGPILVWAYKAINTLDSIVGHKNERFAEFGAAAAMLDRIMNFIPAKITCILICVSSFCCRRDWLNAFKQWLKYLFRGFVVNSESTEAVMAGGLGIRLGGTNYYGSQSVHKPFIGVDFQPLVVEHIRQSVQIAYVSSALMLILIVAL